MPTRGSEAVKTIPKRWSEATNGAFTPLEPQSRFGLKSLGISVGFFAVVKRLSPRLTLETLHVGHVRPPCHDVVDISGHTDS